MNNQPMRLRPREKNQEGIALITVLMVLVLLLLLGLAVVFVSTSEIRSSRSYERQSQGLLLAEAGGAHALDLVRNMTWQLPNGFDPILLGPDGLPNTADDGCLCDDARVGGPIFNGVTGIPVVAPGFALAPGSYFARAYDDDSTLDLDGDGQPDLNLTAPPSEDGNPFTDGNGRIIVRVTARGEGQSEAVVDFTISRKALPALLVNGEAEVEDGAQILGDFGSVHSNCDPPPDFDPTDTGVEVDTTGVIDQDATSSCQIEVDDPSMVNGEILTGEPVIPIPPLTLPQPPPLDPYGPDEINLPALSDIILVGDDVDPEDGDRDEPFNILRAAGIDSTLWGVAPPTTTTGVPLDPNEEFVAVLTADAQSRLPAGACPTVPCYIQPLPDVGGGGGPPGAGDNTFGWVIQGDDFNLVNAPLSDGLTVYGVGEDFELQNNVGDPDNPIQLTLLAAEEIEIEANVNLTPDLVLTQDPFDGAPLQLWANEEIEVDDDDDNIGSLNSTGLIYVGEEFECDSDAPSLINGQVMVAGEMNEEDAGDAVGDGEAELEGNCTLRLDDPLLAVGNWAHTGWRQIKR